jgi:hypothetical protein
MAGARRLMRWAEDGQPAAVTHPGVTVGSWLHAYGGGSYEVSKQGIWFTDAHDSSLHLLDRHGAHRKAVEAQDGVVYGDLRVCGQGLVAVRETEHGGDQIVCATLNGQVRVLVRSAGFLSAPTTDRGRLAYVEWDADQMPWDCTTLRVTDLDARDRAGTAEQIAGGPGEWRSHAIETGLVGST